MDELTYFELLELVAGGNAPEAVQFQGEMYTYNKKGNCYEGVNNDCGYCYLLSHISNTLGELELVSEKCFKPVKKFTPHLKIEMTEKEANEMVREIISKVKRNIYQIETFKWVAFPLSFSDNLYTDIMNVLKERSI